MTELLDLSTDVLVIGGGPAGTWAALRARQSGADVVLRRQGVLRHQRRHRAFGHRRLVRRARPVRAGEGQGQPRSARRPSRRPPLDGPRPRPDVREHESPRRGGPVPVPRRPRHGRQIRTGLQGPEVHAADAGLGQAGRRPDPRPLPGPRTARRRRRPGARRGGLPAPRRPRLPGHARAPSCSRPAAARSCPGALGTQRRHRRRRADGRRGGRDVLRHGVLQRVRDRPRQLHHHQDRLLRLRHVLPRRRTRPRGRRLHQGALGDRENAADRAGVRPDSTAPTTTRSARCASASPTSSCNSTVAASTRSPTASRSAARRGHGARHRRHRRGRRHLRHLRPRPVRGGRRRHPRTICGGFTGGGSHNSAWAMSSGSWAGAGAARFARTERRVRAGELRPAGRAGLRPTGRSGLEASAVVAAAQAELIPYDKNYLRHGVRVQACARRAGVVVDGVVAGARRRPGDERVRARQAAAITAVGRWMYHSRSRGPKPAE